jgi:hypothetical protein
MKSPVCVLAATNSSIIDAIGLLPQARHLLKLSHFILQPDNFGIKLAQMLIGHIDERLVHERIEMNIFWGH